MIELSETWGDERLDGEAPGSVAFDDLRTRVPEVERRKDWLPKGRGYAAATCTVTLDEYRAGLRETKLADVGVADLPPADRPRRRRRIRLVDG